MKKSMADMIIVDPTMLDATIVTNLTHSNVVTANTIAPPPTATAISRNCEEEEEETIYEFTCNIPKFDEFSCFAFIITIRS